MARFGADYGIAETYGARTAIELQSRFLRHGGVLYRQIRREMSAGRKSDDKHFFGIDKTFRRMFFDVIHRRGKLNELIGISRALGSGRISQDKGLKAPREKRGSDRFALSLADHMISSARHYDDRGTLPFGSLPVERKVEKDTLQFSALDSVRFFQRYLVIFHLSYSIFFTP